ncbi:MAG: fumarylacetoacetate hydrolase family protein [Planctomycetota bacterium]|nr:fumarylacetoacetate hydrolase family protein [Planctomycetota bacterium]
MKLVKYRTSRNPKPRVGRVLSQTERGWHVQALGSEPGLLTQLLHSENVAAAVSARGGGAEEMLEPGDLLAPLDLQEVWGAGVTYERSKVARQEESPQGGSFYDQVYTADRPELFMKATPSRVSGPGAALRVRRDSQWSVPEPELALVLTPDMRLAGYTVGNDMSARDIEGRNPLYLPQAKVYEACCGLGPCVVTPDELPNPSQTVIRLVIERDGAVVFAGETSTSRLARRFEDLAAWLGIDNVFPDGVILLTGTGIVPPDDFSLRGGDRVAITIHGIGTLENPIEQAATIAAS